METARTARSIGVGARVAAARDKAGLSQEQLARRADISVSLLSRLERGNVPNISFEVMGRIARVLGVLLDDLYADPSADELTYRRQLAARLAQAPRSVWEDVFDAAARLASIRTLRFHMAQQGPEGNGEGERPADEREGHQE